MADNYTLGVTVKATTEELQASFERAQASLEKFKTELSNMSGNTQSVQKVADKFSEVSIEADKATSDVSETKASVEELSGASKSVEALSGSFVDITDSASTAQTEIASVKTTTDAISSSSGIDELSSDLDLAGTAASEAAQDINVMGTYVESVGTTASIDELKTDFDLAGVAAQQAGVDIDSLKASTDSIGTGTGIDNLRSDFDLAGAAAAQAAASIDEGYVSLQRIARGTSLDPVQGEFVQLGSAADEAKVSIDGVDVSLSDLATSGAGLGVVENQFAEIANEAQKATSQVSEVGEKAKAVGSAQAPVKGLAGAFFKSTLAAQGVSKAVQLVSDHIGGAVRRVDTLNNANSVFQNMGYSATEASDVINNKLSSAIDGLPTRLDEAVSSTQMLAASTGDLSKSAELYGAINDAVLGFDGSAADAQNAVLQLSQGFANGKLQGQEWMSMINSQMGPVLNAMADDMGITTEALKGGLSSGAISVEEFQDSLIKLDQQGGGSLKSLNQIAKDNTKGIATSISNVGAHIEKGIGEIITAVNQLAESAIGQSIGEMISSVIPYIDSAASAMGSAITAIGQPVSELPAQFQGPMGSIKSSFSSLADTAKTAMSQMDFSGLKDLGQAILPAVAAGFQAFIQVAGPAFEGLINSFTGLWNALQPLLSTLAGALMPAFEILGSFLGGVFKGVLMTVQGLFDALRIVIELLTPVVNLVVQAFQLFAPAFQVIAEWIGVLFGLFAQFSFNLNALKTPVEVVRTFFVNAWENIVTSFNVAKLALSNGINAIKGFFNGLKSSGNVLKGALQAVWNAITNAINTARNIINGAINGIKSFFSSLGSAGHSLKSAISNAWNAMVSVISSAKSKISGIIDGIRNIFHSLSEINLWDAGVAIINSFIDGLRNTWDNFKGWFSEIGGWIFDHKGPIRDDRKLLIPAGKAIMEGLNRGLADSFKTVQSNVSKMANQIARSVKGSIGVSSDTTITRKVTTRVEPPKMNVIPTVVDMNANRSTSTGISGVNNKLDNAIDLMTQILNKDDNVYLDRELLSTRIGDDIRRRTEITTKYQNRRKGVLA